MKKSIVKAGLRMGIYGGFIVSCWGIKRLLSENKNLRQGIKSYEDLVQMQQKVIERYETLTGVKAAEG